MGLLGKYNIITPKNEKYIIGNRKFSTSKPVHAIAENILGLPFVVPLDTINTLGVTLEDINANLIHIGRDIITMIGITLVALALYADIPVSVNQEVEQVISDPNMSRQFFDLFRTLTVSQNLTIDPNLYNPANFTQLISTFRDLQPLAETPMFDLIHGRLPQGDDIDTEGPFLRISVLLQSSIQTLGRIGINADVLEHLRLPHGSMDLLRALAAMLALIERPLFELSSSLALALPGAGQEIFQVVHTSLQALVFLLVELHENAWVFLRFNNNLLSGMDNFRDIQNIQPDIWLGSNNIMRVFRWLEARLGISFADSTIPPNHLDNRHTIDDVDKIDLLFEDDNI